MVDAIVDFNEPDVASDVRLCPAQPDLQVRLHLGAHEVDRDIGNGDFLRPDVLSFIQYYRQLLINDDVNAKLGREFTTS